MSDLEDLQAKQDRFRQLLRTIANYNTDISIPDIVLYLEYKEEQVSSFNKCAQGKPFPKFLNANIDLLLNKLEEGASNPDLIRDFNESLIADGHKGYRRSPRPVLVWIPFDTKLSVTDFNGSKQPISFTEIQGQMGIVAYRSTSRSHADGDVFVHQVGMTADLEPGMRIAIKRIDKLEWRTDRYYLIVEASEQMHIRALLPGDDENTVKYASTTVPGSPYTILPLNKIVVLFSIVDGYLIPTPKKSTAAVSISQ